MAGERLVHGIVDHLGEEMVQRLLVGSADIHARPPPHRLKPFQDLDVLGGVSGISRWSARAATACAIAARFRRVGKKVGHFR